MLAHVWVQLKASVHQAEIFLKIVTFSDHVNTKYILCTSMYTHQKWCATWLPEMASWRKLLLRAEVIHIVIFYWVPLMFGIDTYINSLETDTLMKLVNELWKKLSCFFRVFTSSSGARIETKIELSRTLASGHLHLVGGAVQRGYDRFHGSNYIKLQHSSCSSSIVFFKSLK